MKYKCEICGVIFDEPKTVAVAMSDGTFSWTEYDRCCPICGEQYFEEVELCEQCNNGYKLPYEAMCDECKKELLEKAKAFFHTLTYPQIKRLDNWWELNPLEEMEEWK